MGRNVAQESEDRADMANDDRMKACREQIPGIEGNVDVLVREGFWYSARLNEGWAIKDVSADSGGSFAAVAPDGADIRIVRGSAPGGLANKLATQIAWLAHLDERLGGNLVQQLAALINWRSINGPISEPEQFSTVSQDFIVEELKAALDRRDVAGELPPLPNCA